MIAGNDEFDSLKNILKEKCDIGFNPLAADEHVAKMECMIHVVKKRIGASCSPMPWKKMIPKLTMREVAKIL